MTLRALLSALVIGCALSASAEAQTQPKGYGADDQVPKLSWPEGPSPDYFTGIYARVGRGAGDDPALINDLVRISPGADGLSLELVQCLGTDATGAGAEFAPLTLVHSNFSEVPNILVAGGQPEPMEGELWCQYFNDSGNYAILTCANEFGVRFTLWAEPQRAAEECKTAE